MKKDIHPKYSDKATVTCACGNTFVTGSVMPEIKIELCSECHPFYTGKQKLVDAARRVEKFQAKVKKSETEAKVKKGKTVKRAAKDAARKKREVVVKVQNLDDLKIEAKAKKTGKTKKAKSKK